MKSLEQFLFTFTVLILAILLPPEASAQRKQLPGQLNDNSTVSEILKHLNQTTIPYARIGMKTRRPGSSSTWHPKTGWEWSRGSLVFSPGFKLVSGFDDCHLKLRNDDVKVFEDDKPFDLQNLAGTSGPYVAEFGTWLETVSYDKGRDPFLRTKQWRTEFNSRGFFVRGVFGIELPAIKRGAGNESLTASTVSFMFADKEMSEQFNAAFRRVIQLCQPRSTKSRWNR